MDAGRNRPTVPSRRASGRRRAALLLFGLVLGLGTPVAQASVHPSPTAQPAPTSPVALPWQSRQKKKEDQKKHTHQWVKLTRKEWVPPVEKRVQVGTDSKGKPIYKTKLVRAGYYKKVTYYRCRGCQRKRS